MNTSGVRDSLGDVKDIDEGKRQVLITIPWETLDSYSTDFSKDCFDDYLGQRSPIICWQHAKTEPIGRVQTWQKGERANEFVGEFSDFDAVPRAKQAFAQIRDGHLTDFSFYYDQAKAIPHPNGQRGNMRFTKARMPELSPVSVGSIPGAMATGVREAADMNAIAELVKGNVITAVEGRNMLGLLGTAETAAVEEIPGERSTITVSEDVTTALADLRAEIAELRGSRTDDDGEKPAELSSDELTELASTVDRALTDGRSLLAGVDTGSLPTEVQEALGLFEAAGVATDAMLDTMGVPALELAGVAAGGDPAAAAGDAGGGDGGRSTEEQNDDESTAGERATVPDPAVEDLELEADAALALLNQRFTV